MTKLINCLLCCSQHVEIDESISGSQLKKLWENCGNHLTDTAYGSIKQNTAIHLFRCLDCGFRYYNPEFAGSAQFYEELMVKKKYPSDSPEFFFALTQAKDKNLERIMDVGCGEGAFLDMAREAGFKTTGVELNRNAAAIAANKGHFMFDKLIEHISVSELDGGVDMLTLFQVLEHVPNPVEFINDAAKLIRPGGYIVIGVPSELRMLGLLHYDPANWPPHHITRWRQADFNSLASMTGLILKQVSNDTLYGRAIEWAWNYRNDMASIIGQKKLLGGKWFPKLISASYRWLACKKYIPCHGLSIYGIFQKP